MGAASFQSVPEMFLHRVASTPDSDAFYYPIEEDWKTMSWREVGDKVRAISCGLLSQGVKAEERCSILCSTRVEWILADIGILCAAAATTTIYPTNTPEECQYIISDSDSRFVFVENTAQLAKINEIREQIPNVTRVIIIEDDRKSHESDEWVVSLDALIREGMAWDRGHEGLYEEVTSGVTSDQLATLIYTSGTTGKPKGVELVHDAWVFEGEAMDALGFLSPADKQYLFLPLAHSFAKVLESAIIRIGIPTAIDGRIDMIVPNLAVVQPTFMGAVPRIFEKVYNKVVSGAQEAGGVKERIFGWSIRTGGNLSTLQQQGQTPGGLLALKGAVADKLVFSKLKATFGGKVRFFISGGAPLSREIAEFFHACGILILEGYGLTESSAASFVNSPGAYKFGTVGKALPGVEVKIAESDQEIMIKSRGVMRGYRNRPEDTKEVLAGEGWLRTGDIGSLSADGFLKITDRKKDLIKTSGGKYVAPQELENRLKAMTPYISQVLVHGNNRNFCTALIALNEEVLEKWVNRTGIGPLSYMAMAEHPSVRRLIEPVVDKLNGTLPSHETIKKFAFLPSDLTIEAGELTPTMKVKRKVIEEEYRDVLNDFYDGAIAAI